MILAQCFLFWHQDQNGVPCMNIEAYKCFWSYLLRFRWRTKADGIVWELSVYLFALTLWRYYFVIVGKKLSGVSYFRSSLVSGRVIHAGLSKNLDWSLFRLVRQARRAWKKHPREKKLPREIPSQVKFLSRLARRTKRKRDYLKWTNIRLNDRLIARY